MGLQAFSLVGFCRFLEAKCSFLWQESNLPSKAWQAAPQPLPFSGTVAFAYDIDQATLA